MADGNRNTGYRNTGSFNTGHHNTGSCNTGYRNTGNYNTGHRNTGHRNTGSFNTGSYNVGIFNTGSYNVGHYNTGNRNVGFFMTTTPEVVPVFDSAPVNLEEFLKSLPGWLDSVAPSRWVQTFDMTDAEKKEHPSHETTGGFLRTCTMHEAFAAAWEESDQDVAAVEGILGFNRNVWIKITGLDLWADDETEPLETITVNGVTYVRAQD